MTPEAQEPPRPVRHVVSIEQSMRAQMFAGVMFARLEQRLLAEGWKPDPLGLESPCGTMRMER